MSVALESMNNKIIESRHHPFGISAYNPDKPITDFVGRHNELHHFKEYMQIILVEKNSLAVKLVGPAGLGKSTLFNYLKQIIEMERNNDKIEPEYLDENTDILSTYFRLPGNVTSFRHLWTEMLDGLRGVISSETDMEIGFPEYVALKIIYRFYQLSKDSISAIIWENIPIPKDLKYIKFEDIIEPIIDNATIIVPQIQKYYNENKSSLRRKMLIELNGETYRITRRDNKLINNLFRVLNEDDNFLDQIRSKENSIFRNDDDLINYLNDLLRLYTCASQKIPILLIGIDEIAKYNTFEGYSKKDYYKNIASLFTKLRDKLKGVLLVLISTTDDWADFDSTISKFTDLTSQLQPVIKEMQLNQLPVEDAIQVFKKRIAGFWKNYERYQSSTHPYYPFSEDVFRYVLMYNHRDLRASIDFLNRLWMSYKSSRQIPWFQSGYHAIHYIREFANDPIDGRNIETYEWELMEWQFEHDPTFKSNTARSAAIESGLENAWKCLQQESMSVITKVENNPTVKTTSGSRRPDVLVELKGNIGRDALRKVEFQVKAHLPGKVVSFKEIRSSIELFNMHYTDMIYFLITGEGLDSTARYEVQELTIHNSDRIVSPGLNLEQKRMLIFLALYPQVVGWEIGERQDYDIEVMKYVLSIILGEPVNEFLQRVCSLATREPLDGSHIITDPPRKKGDEKLKIVPGQITKPVVRPRPSPVPIATWMQLYPFMQSIKYEACALGQYLQTRENHKKYENMFTINTVNSKYIQNDNLLNRKRFKKLVDDMIEKEMLTKAGKSMFELTESGLEWYKQIKEADFTVG